MAGWVGSGAGVEGDGEADVLPEAPAGAPEGQAGAHGEVGGAEMVAGGLVDGEASGLSDGVSGMADALLRGVSADGVVEASGAWATGFGAAT
ncbi:hypothetical protein [Streptantibioticus silvisoli]|uniref:Uncharacterized protein n=1 Tax=Streptantibioticus silvisoli TaxID=2705255 RepID=A0ABT6W4K6_9ACTN|nr:hypothetical protein [Streptantibioticus silvisoli]MDI5965683.1 hypothetical protein [Streptantibioticus silvisoli]